MIKQFTAGNRTFSNNMIQGPLAGISSAPFRLLCARFSRPALAYTEMISCKTLIYDSKNGVSPFLEQLPGEGPLGVQLSGTCPRELAEAVKISEAAGAATVDLNCGCPVKKIRQRGAGSALLALPAKLYEMIHAMKQNTTLPVSVKIRVDGNHDTFNQGIVHAVRDAGLDFLIVHGRNWRDDYDVACHYEQIRYIVDALDLPVIGNGDISGVDSMKKMFETGCAGVMVSRASVGQPWLIHNLLAEARQQPVFNPVLEEIGNVFLEHVQLLADFTGSEKKAVMQSRKFCKYYARPMPNKMEFCMQVYRCQDFQKLGKTVKKYFVTKSCGY